MAGNGRRREEERERVPPRNMRSPFPTSCIVFVIIGAVIYHILYSSILNSIYDFHEILTTFTPDIPNILYTDRQTGQSDKSEFLNSQLSNHFVFILLILT